MESHSAATTTTAAGDDRKWCEIPADILYRLLRCLDSKIDVLRLRGVCSSWRSSLPLPPTTPQLNLPPLQTLLPSPLLRQTHFFLLSPLTPNPNNPNPKNPKNPRKPKNPSADGKWLARMIELETPNKWHLLNPLASHTDYFTANPPVTASLNLLHCQILHLSTVFSLLNPSNSEPISKKVVVGGTGGYNTNFTDFAVLVLLEVKHDSGGGLLLWRSGDQQWIPIHGTTKPNNGGSRTHFIVDIAFHKGKFYAFDLSTWRIGIIDPCSNSSSLQFIASLDDCLDFLKQSSFYEGRMWVDLPDPYKFEELYLVSFLNGGLYLIMEVEDDPFKSRLFVFVLKEVRNSSSKWEWEQVSSLGEQVFFIGLDFSFSLCPASQRVLEGKSGSICLFTGFYSRFFPSVDREGDWEMIYSDHITTEHRVHSDYLRFFHVEKLEEEEEEEEGRGVGSFRLYLPKPGHGMVIFPPPPWVQWRCPSCGDVEVKLFGFNLFY